VAVEAGIEAEQALQIEMQTPSQLFVSTAISAKLMSFEFIPGWGELCFICILFEGMDIEAIGISAQAAAGIDESIVIAR